jgi:hypothetical protein
VATVVIASAAEGKLGKHSFQCPDGPTIQQIAGPSFTVTFDLVVPTPPEDSLKWLVKKSESIWASVPRVRIGATCSKRRLLLA